MVKRDILITCKFADHTSNYYFVWLGVSKFDCINSKLIFSFLKNEKQIKCRDQWKNIPVIF